MARRVGNWELDPVPIGSGSFAIVWKARHVDTAVQAAVKEINTERLSPKLLESLESEVAVLRRTQHRNIVRMLDLIQEPGKMFLVLEFCGGGDLGQYLRRYRCVNEPTARYFMHQLSEGLRELYALNVLHRDLKPQNLLLSDTSMTPILKIADFGFARSLQPQGMAETLCGSPLYMAPEILQSHKYDAKADLWSVGTILHELLTGRPPFTGTNHIQLLHNIQRLEPRLAEALPGHLSQPCRQLLLRLLRHRPQERMGFDEFFQHPFVQGQQAQQGRDQQAQGQQGPQGLGRADRQPSASQGGPAAQDERGQRLGSAQEAAAHDRRHHQQPSPTDQQQQQQQHVHQHQQQPQRPHKRSGQQQLQQQQQGGADSDCEYVVVSGSSSPAPNLAEQQAAAPGVTAFANWTQSVHATATAAAGALAGLGPSASAHTAGRGAHALHVHQQQHQHQQHHRNTSSRRAHAPVAMARRAAPVMASMASAWAAAAAQAVATVARSVQHASPSSASSRQAAAAAAAASRGTFFHYPQLSASQVSGQAPEPAVPAAIAPREQDVTRISSGDKQAPSEQPSTPSRPTAASGVTAPAGGAAKQPQVDVPVDAPAGDAGSGRHTGDTPARPPGASPSTTPQRQQEQQGGGKDLDTALLWRCARLPERLDGADLLQRVVLLLSESANARASAAEAAELAAEEHEEDEGVSVAGLQEGAGLPGKAGEDIEALQRARRRQFTAQVAAGALPGQLLALHLYSCQLLEAGLASTLGKSVDGLCQCEEREAPSGASAGGMPEAKGGESETAPGTPSAAACTAEVSEQQAESQPASGRTTAAALGRTTDPRLLLPLKRQAASLLSCLKGRTMRLLRGQIAEQQLLQAKAAAPSKGEQAACMPYALDDEEAGQVAAAAVVPEPAAAVLDAALRYSRAAAADELLGLLPASVEGYARAADLLLFLLADLHAPPGWPGPAAPGAEAGSLLPEHLKPKMSPEERQRVHSIYAAVKLRQASCMAALNAQLSV